VLVPDAPEVLEVEPEVLLPEAPDVLDPDPEELDDPEISSSSGVMLKLHPCISPPPATFSLQVATYLMRPLRVGKWQLPSLAVAEIHLVSPVRQAHRRAWLASPDSDLL
jgi:hypothetical protein